jgi:hypothetical protein
MALIDVPAYPVLKNWVRATSIMWLRVSVIRFLPH